MDEDGDEGSYVTISLRHSVVVVGTWCQAFKTHSHQAHNKYIFKLKNFRWITLDFDSAGQ